MSVFLWIGMQLYMSGELTPEKSSFLPLMNTKDSSFRIMDTFTEWTASLLRWLPFGAINDETTDSMQSNQQQMDEDYIFVFYVLLCINVLAMLPSLFHRYIKHKTTMINESSTQNELKSTSPIQQNDHHLENHQQYQMQQLQLEEEKRIIHHNLFYKTYLPAYLLATSADWLQGPYKYALYSSYGYTQRDIAHLFVVGYGSGMVLGSIVGGLADGYGRKRLCLCYCIAYAVSVTCTHFKDYYVLLLGRCGGGVGTSLLFSVFESWLIGAHIDRGLVDKDGDGGEKWLAESFSVGMYGSSLVAIGSGVLANFIVARSGRIRPLHSGDESDDGDASIFLGGYIAAFDACWPILMCCATLIVLMWEENYGEQDHTSGEKVAMSLSLEVNGPLPNKNNGVDIEPKQLDYGYLKKHSSIHHLNDDEQISDHDESSSLLHEIESQSNGQSHTAETNSHHKDGMFSTLWNGMVTVWNSPNILMCCIIGSFFEGAM
jgi:hypothetical protein